MIFFHTPLHYLKTLKYNNNNLIKKSKIGLVLLTTILSVIAIKFDVKLEESLVNIGGFHLYLLI